MSSVRASAATFSFGPFRLIPSARLLERDGVALAIGGRALDILTILAEHAGEVVGNNDLIALVWPDVCVDESNVRVHVAALRKLIGDGRSGARYLTNVPRRGYALVAPVTRSTILAAPDGEERSPPLRKLPAPLDGMIGRDNAVRAIERVVLAHRFVTVIGPGGIGKTTVALAAAHNLVPAVYDQASFIDLRPLDQPRPIFAEVAASLGLPLDSDAPVAGLAASMRDLRLLLVLDGCEHVIRPLTILAEALFRAAPTVHVLATSREALRVEGEHLYRLPTLAAQPGRLGPRAAVRDLGPSPS